MKFCCSDFEGQYYVGNFWISEDTLFVENNSGDGGVGRFERVK